MKKLLYATLLGACCMAGCDKNAHSSAETHPQLVKDMVISGSASGREYLYPARVTAGEEANLTFAVSGDVTAILVKEGQTVTKGTLLAQLNPRDYQNRYDEAKAQYELTRTNLNRFRILLKSKTVSRSEYDQKAADYKVAAAMLDTAKKALDDTYIKAPYDGVVARRFVEQYENVQAKQPILLLQNLNSVEVFVNIPEEDIARGRKMALSEDANAKQILPKAVSFSTLPGRRFDAMVKEFSTRADPKTLTYQVRLIVNQVHDARILPGMSAQARIKYQGVASSTIEVPVDAVGVDEHGKNFVWLIDMSSLTANKQLVKVGMMSNGNILITDGLKAGQRIVIAGVSALQQGMKVKILPEKMEN